MKNDRRNSQRMPTSADCFATVWFTETESAIVLVSDISSGGAGLIVEQDDAAKISNRLQISYQDFHFNAQVVNRYDLQDGQIRIGVSWEKCGAQANLPSRHMIFVYSCSNDERYTLEQFRPDGRHLVEVSETELTKIIEFLVCPYDANEPNNQNLTLDDDIQLRRFRSDGSFSIQRGVCLLYGTGDIRQNLQPMDTPRSCLK